MKLDEFLKDADGKAEFDAAVQKAIDDAAAGLKNKNKELLGKLKTAETERDEAVEKADAAIQEGGSKNADVEKIKKSLEDKHTRELTKERTEKEGLKGQLNNLLIDQGLTDALTKNGIAPQFVPAVRALIKTQHKPVIGEDGGEPAALVDGKPLAEFVKTWSQGDQGKHYAAAQNNGGGGAQGSGGKSKGDAEKTITRSEFEAKSPADRMKAAKEGVKVVDE